MLILAGTVRIAPGRRAEAIPHIQALVAAVRQEPGCIDYSFAFDVSDDHLIHIFEIYKDEAALDFHRKAPHFAAWRKAFAADGIVDRNLTRYDVAGSQKL